MLRLSLPVLCGLFALSGIAQDKAEKGVQDTKVQKADPAVLMREGRAAVDKENWVEATAKFKALTEVQPRNGQAWLMLGYALHADKKLDEALPIHIKATEFPTVRDTAAYNVACVYALKGDKDKAIEWLKKAIEFGFGDAAHAEDDTDFDSIKSDQRFKDLVARMKAAPAARGGAPAQAFATTTERKCARLAYFGGSGSPGQLALDYAPVGWKDGYDQAIDSPKMVGKKWRFGKDYWTSLDSSMPVTIGGVEFPAGYYFLTLTNKGDKKFVLNVHDAAEVKKQHLDASAADKVQGGKEVPLEYEKGTTKADELQISILNGDNNTEATLTILFGGHKLYAKMGIRL